MVIEAASANGRTPPTVLGRDGVIPLAGECLNDPAGLNSDVHTSPCSLVSEESEVQS